MADREPKSVPFVVILASIWLNVENLECVPGHFKSGSADIDVPQSSTTEIRTNITVLKIVYVHKREKKRKAYSEIEPDDGRVNPPDNNSSVDFTLKKTVVYQSQRECRRAMIPRGNQGISHWPREIGRFCGLILGDVGCRCWRRSRL